MIESQELPLGHLISLATRFPLCPTGGAGMASAMRYLCQYPLMVHAMRTVYPICRHGVIRQHPWLLRLRLPGEQLGRGEWSYAWAWLDTQEQIWGSKILTEPLTDEDWQYFGHPRAPRAEDPDGEPLTFGFLDPVLTWEDRT